MYVAVACGLRLDIGEVDKTTTYFSWGLQYVVVVFTFGRFNDSGQVLFYNRVVQI